MAYYHPQNVQFPTYVAYCNNIQISQQHVEPNWKCDVCNRSFATEQSRHHHYLTVESHLYCVCCRRLFQSENNLMQHMHSKTQTGGTVQCPFCKETFATASGVTIHLESGTCSSGMDRHKINAAIRNLDRNHIITKPLITAPSYDNFPAMATARAWNGSAFECYLCQRNFSRLDSLNRHLASPAHDQKIYHCPNRTCRVEFKLLSSLVQHFESESCGLFRFADVQRQAKNGVQNMIGRMLEY